MNDLQAAYWEKKLTHITAALKKNRFNPHICDDSETAKKQIISMIPENSKIGVGGSETLAQLNIIDELLEKKYNVINPAVNGIPYETVIEQRKNALHSDVFLCSSNAVTQDGFLVNVDYLSNRVAAMMFGPKEVIIVVGINKIVEDVDSALRKIRDYTAPQNSMRLKRNTPCVQTAKCENCNSPDRICSNISIMGFQRDADRIHIILVKENLGI